MNFSNIEVTANGSQVVFQPYDRGANGAFVYRKSGATVHAPRLVLSTQVNDSSNDKLTVQNNVPRVCPSDESCGVDKILGTDLVKTELRFLATTSEQDRKATIDTHIALLQELRDVIETRQVIYA